jgi:Lon protease-like protein
MLITQAVIPIFAIPTVIFPDEQLPFHIYEERYQKMVSFCLQNKNKGTSGMFGITCITEEVAHQIGCAVKIERVLEEYPDGRRDILVRGTIRYRMVDIDRSGEFPRATVEYFDDLSHPDHSLVGRAVTLHIKMVELAKGHTITPDFGPGDKVSFALAHNAGLSLEERQRFLEMRHEYQRLEFLIEFYKKNIPLIQKNREIQDRIHANGNIRVLRSLSL